MQRGFTGARARGPARERAAAARTGGGGGEKPDVVAEPDVGPRREVHRRPHRPADAVVPAERERRACVEDAEAELGGQRRAQRGRQPDRLQLRFVLRAPARVRSNIRGLRLGGHARRRRHMRIAQHAASRRHAQKLKACCIRVLVCGVEVQSPRTRSPGMRCERAGSYF